MASNFSKEELVMFEDVLEGFDDQLVISKAVDLTRLADDQTMERASDRIWRPMPFIATSYSGIDQTANFGDITQMSVPINLGQHRSVPGLLSSKQLRDPNQLAKYGIAAKQKLSSDINYACMTAAALQGSVVSKRTSTPTGFDDVADCDALLTEIGVETDQRYAFYSARDYNSMASNLASRVLDNSNSADAYRKAYVGEIAGFETYKNDVSYSLSAATATGVTLNAANQYYVPAGSTTDALGNTTNIDNRYQTISIAVTTNTVKVGDAFTIAGVYSVHYITKQPTTTLKTFRITAIVTGAGGTGTITITPPIVSGGGGSKAELQYQNVSATPANGAVVTFLNTVTARVNPFFRKEAIQLIPGSFAVDPQDGWQVMRGTTDLGIALTYARQGNINDFSLKYRWDVDFGVAVMNTEMAGIQLFSQT